MQGLHLLVQLEGMEPESELLFTDRKDRAAMEPFVPQVVGKVPAHGRG